MVAWWNNCPQWLTWLSSSLDIYAISFICEQENLANIQEYSDAGVTIRGTYFPQGKEPKEDEGERKLYLSIESKLCSC